MRLVVDGDIPRNVYYLETSTRQNDGTGQLIIVPSRRLSYVSPYETDRIRRYAGHPGQSSAAIVPRDCEPRRRYTRAPLEGHVTLTRDWIGLDGSWSSFAVHREMKRSINTRAYRRYIRRCPPAPHVRERLLEGGSLSSGQGRCSRAVDQGRSAYGCSNRPRSLSVRCMQRADCPTETKIKKEKQMVRASCFRIPNCAACSSVAWRERGGGVALRDAQDVRAICAPYGAGRLIATQLPLKPIARAKKVVARVLRVIRAGLEQL